jgi:hypothetical protein
MMASFQTFSITCECFSQKGDLELLTGVKYEDYEPLLDDVWQHFLDVNLRYMHLISQSESIIRVSFNFCILYVTDKVSRLKIFKDGQLLAV